MGEIAEHHAASSGHPKEYPYFKKVSALACLNKNMRGQKQKERDKKIKEKNEKEKKKREI